MVAVDARCCALNSNFVSPDKSKTNQTGVVNTVIPYVLIL